MHWRIELFGGLRAVYANEMRDQFRSRKTAALLAYLAFFRGPHPRDQLVELLWPDFPLEAGRNSLRVALADLRRRSSLADESGVVFAPPLLEQGNGSVGLCREVTTDVADFEKAVEEARRTLSQDVRIAAYERAQALYQGTLLPGLYEDWIPIEEARLESSFLHVLKSLQGHYDNVGDAARAFELAQLAARIEPRDKRETVVERSQPVALTKARAQSDRERAPLFASPFTPSTRQMVAMVPAAFTRFFGRDTELRDLSIFLLEGETRLLTLTGGGGLGKTRLALELAQRLERPKAPLGEAQGFERVFWVPLADIGEADRLPEDLIKALNLAVEASEGGGHRQRLLEAIARFLRGDGERDSRVLLVLDNFEQLLPQGAAFLGELLERVPHLTLLVTSRQRLNLAGELEHRIGALSLPSPTASTSPERAHEMAWDAQQLAMLRDSSSVQLFADRARSARADWRLLPRDAPTLVALLYRLEGIPLAIELVASRCGVLSLDQMLSRLSHSLQWVSSRDLQRPLRHRSLHAVLEWSLQLLPVGEREIFARLSVFHGGWTLEHASAVLSDMEPDALLDALQSLRDASLITSEESMGGELRFSMLEIVRQIASERLDGALRVETRCAHAEFYFQLAQRASTRKEDYGKRGVWGATEGHNFSAALDFWSSEDLERGLEMASLLWWHWIFNHHLVEGRQFLRALLADPRAENFPIARARAQDCAAYIALLSGDYNEMDSHLRAALAMWTGEEFKKERAGTLNLSGALAHARGEKEKARHYYEQSLALHRVVSTGHELTIAINALAGLERECGRIDIARALCDEALERAHRDKDVGAESWAYHTLGFLALDEGDLSGARNYQTRSLEIRRACKQLSGQAACLDALGEVAFAEGDFERGRNDYEQALRLWQQIKHLAKARATQEKLEAQTGPK